MKKLSLYCRVFSIFVSVIMSIVPVKTLVANEDDQNDLAADTPEFRIELEINTDKARSSQDFLKEQFLNEKLIKLGRSKSQGCTRCHGRSGMQSMAESSHWVGSVAEFVANGLTEFRDGKRMHEVMSSIAATLSDQDIALIALWYQSVSTPK